MIIANTITQQHQYQMISEWTKRHSRRTPTAAFKLLYKCIHIPDLPSRKWDYLATSQIQLQLSSVRGWAQLIKHSLYAVQVSMTQTQIFFPLLRALIALQLSQLHHSKIQGLPNQKRKHGILLVLPHWGCSSQVYHLNEPVLAHCSFSSSRSMSGGSIGSSLCPGRHTAATLWRIWRSLLPGGCTKSSRRLVSSSREGVGGELDSLGGSVPFISAISPSRAAASYTVSIWTSRISHTETTYWKTSSAFKLLVKHLA